MSTTLCGRISMELPNAASGSNWMACSREVSTRTICAAASRTKKDPAAITDASAYAVVQVSDCLFGFINCLHPRRRCLKNGRNYNVLMGSEQDAGPNFTLPVTLQSVSSNGRENAWPPLN